MKLEATCDNCRRRFLIAQIKAEPEGTGGRCPFCGFRFARHYVTTLPHIIDKAEQAADVFMTAVEHLNDMHPGFHLDVDAIIQRMTEALSAPAERSA